MIKVKEKLGITHKEKLMKKKKSQMLKIIKKEKEK